jgi:hypothetical protein
MSTKFKVLIATAVLGLVGGLSTVGVPSAHALTGTEYCDHNVYCANAWSGGPLVKSYQYSSTSNNFWNIQVNTNYCNQGYTTSTCPWSNTPPDMQIIQFRFQGGGTYDGDCIGDYQNDPYDAKSGLVGCSGWGANFIYDNVPCGGQNYDAFYNIHWSGSWSTARGFSFPDGNGNQAYNNAVALCLDANFPP